MPLRNVPQPHEAKLVADDRGSYVDCNDIACSLLGYTRDEILGKSVWDLTPDGNQVEGLLLWQEFISRGSDAGVYWLNRKDGTLVEVAYHALANVEPGRHVSWLRVLSPARDPFPKSKLPRSKP